MSDIPTLKKGRKLFAYDKGQGKYFHLEHAILSSPIYPTLPAAFKLAADMILDSHQVARGPEHNDKLLFPVLYLYRHCIELQLKDLVVLGIRWEFFDIATSEQMLHVKENEDDEQETGMLGKHELWPLWNAAKAFLEHRYADDEEAVKQIPVAESYIHQFHHLDPTGQTFRYDRKRGTWALIRFEKLPRLIGVKTLRKAMDGLFFFLDCCYGHTKEILNEGLAAMNDA